MISYIVLALCVVYLAVMFAAVWAAKRRPELASRVWAVDFTLALVLVALNLTPGQPWWLAALWAVNAALAAYNIHLARQRQRDRDIADMWAKRFQNQP